MPKVTKSIITLSGDDLASYVGRLYHLNLTAKPEALLEWPGLPKLRSLDLSQSRVSSRFVQSLAASKLPKLRWLSLANNQDVEQIDVVALCYAIKVRRIGRLRWLGLRGVGKGADATPYLERLGYEEDLWRRPLFNHLLEGIFGLQDWMTFGRSAEEEGRTFISPSEIPPSRF